MIGQVIGNRSEYPMDHGHEHKADRFFLWIDAVGGYWVSLSDQVMLGRPGGAVRAADVAILGDLSARHARLRRDGETYLVEALRDVRVDGRPVSQMAVLATENTLQLGPSVRLRFCRPHALSATARLDFVSRHRTQPSVDAVILMADTCVLGPRPHSHVVCRAWPDEVILYRHEDQLYCRAKGMLEIDGAQYQGRGPVTRNSRIVGDWFSLSLEAIAATGEKRLEP